MATRPAKVAAMTMAMAIVANKQLLARLRDNGDLGPAEAKQAIDALAEAARALRRICQE